jgi:Protein of unknown function (DUF4246)
VTNAMAKYCIDELRYKAKEFERSSTGAIVIYNGDVVKSHRSVSEETKKALQRAVEPLENVPDSQKDWHPGSHERVLDLVHPSLFPLLYGRSRALAIGEKALTLADAASRAGEGNIIPRPEQPQEQTRSYEQMGAYSTKFQWLPCEVDIAHDKPKCVYNFLTGVDSLTLKLQNSFLHQ